MDDYQIQQSVNVLGHLYEAINAMDLSQMRTYTFLQKSLMLLRYTLPKISRSVVATEFNDFHDTKIVYRGTSIDLRIPTCLSTDVAGEVFLYG